jgi:hypothetical protein
MRVPSTRATPDDGFNEAASDRGGERDEPREDGFSHV